MHTRFETLSDYSESLLITFVVFLFRGENCKSALSEKMNNSGHRAVITLCHVCIQHPTSSPWCNREDPPLALPTRPRPRR